MKNNLSFDKFAATLAAMSASSLVAGAAMASPVSAKDTDAFQSVADSVTELGDEKKKKKKKKKKKDDGDEGGCGAGTCG